MKCSFEYRRLGLENFGCHLQESNSARPHATCVEECRVYNPSRLSVLHV